MTKFVLTNDIHLSMRTPISRTDNYHDAVFNKLNQILTLATKIHADAILIAGDIFNEKTRVPIGLIIEFWAWCMAANSKGIRVIGIPGNHDLQNDRYDSLINQPLGLLFIGGAMEDASFKIVQIGEVDIVGIPYPAAKVRDLYNNLPKPTQKRSILMSHCFATVEGGEYFGEPILQYSDLHSLPFDIFHFGHDHSDHGVTRLGDKFFINIGGLSRGSISQDNISREVKCCVVELSENDTKVTQIRLNYKPAGDIFDLVLRAQRDRERNDIEQFVDGLKEDLLEVGPVDFKDKLTTMELPDKIRTRVLTYIEASEATA